MRIDLNCPAELAGAELDEGANEIRLILRNLTDRDINSCEATARVLDREGRELGRTVHRARALKGRAHSAFSMTLPMLLPEGAARTEATIDKVWFVDNEVWRRSPDREIEYEENALPPGNDLNALRYVAGQGAEGFPSQQAAVWVCVCGRANGNGEALCARCRRQKDAIFQQYNRNAVLRQVNQRERQLDLQTRGAREEAAQLQRVREAEYDQRRARRRRAKRIVAVGCVIAVLAVAGVYVIAPGIRLWQADTALREERLEEAHQMLTELGSFPGAESRLAETEARMDWRDGEKAAEASDAFSPEEMRALAARLRATEGAEEIALAEKVELSLGRALLQAGDLEGVETLLQGLPEELAGRDALAADCAFARGQEAMAAREYEKAREIFLALGDYPGAAELATEALYAPALGLMEAGEYDQAIDIFQQISGYQDSEALISQCWYLKGYTLETQGEAEEARLAYLAAGDFEDAAERALAIRWPQAEALLAAQDYEGALPLYRELDGQGDARAKWIQCATALARADYRKRDYAAAAAWLEDLPEDTKDTTQIRTRALYLGAKAAANRGELETAIEMIERVITYSDSARNARNWRLTLARQQMDAEDYDGAREILAPIAENYNAQRLMREIEEKTAVQESAEEAEQE
ncbi:MAG: hypothetical protein IJ153_06735 [Clostridia bacterium]|nr:hypothetical protein [Clostridia bacterium]